MDVADIQQAIEALSSDQQTVLLDWLTERDRLQWDTQIERDFSPGGLGMDLLDHVKTQVHRAESTPMAEHRQNR
jgi:hypothetical protein